MVHITQADAQGVMVIAEPDAPASRLLSPATMAAHLRSTHPGEARCFAEAMHEDVAWANAAWGRFWAEVAELV